jgi:acyl-ACP thioesterase
MVDIWRETASVRFGNVDQSDRLTLGAIFGFFQEASISHAADLGVGRDTLAATGQAWVISRLSVFIKRRPAYGETITISSWPRKWEKLFALRDYEIRDAKNEPVVRGRSGWLVLDIEKRRPLRVQQIMESLPGNDGVDALLSGPLGLESRENLMLAACREARYSDIDYYGHMNNARYIQWIQDYTAPEELSAADEARLDINYLSEVMPGERIEIWTAPLENAGPGEKGNPGDYPSLPGRAFAYEGRRPGSGQAVFRAELRAASFADTMGSV